jgi:hypothetical protein
MAAEQDVEVEDDLARGMSLVFIIQHLNKGIYSVSPEAFEGSEGKDFCAIEEELRLGTRRAIS